MKTVSISASGVHLRHLQLVLVVADRAQALDDRDRALLLAEAGQQTGEAGDAHVGELAGRPRSASRSAPRREEARLRRVQAGGHDHLVEEASEARAKMSM
jgi:hypothetical protein